MQLQKKLYSCYICTVLIFASVILHGQIRQSDWVNQSSRAISSDEELMFQQLPSKFETQQISLSSFKNELREQAQEIILPTPDGGFETYIIEPSNVVAEEVAHFYTIKTFRGHKKGEPSKVIACDISDGGFHAAVYNSNKSYFIEPLYKDVPDQLIVYYNKDRVQQKTQCHLAEHKASQVVQSAGFRSPTAKSTYKLAMIGSGEYSQQFGGSPYSDTNVLNALASGVNMINPIYLRDLGIEFSLVTTAAMVYPTPGPDPFNTNNQGSLLTSCHSECTSKLGSSGFDVGHLAVWENLGGLASFEVVCNDGSKGQGFSGADASLVTLWVDYICHEIGHQFGSEHNFASTECGTSAANFRYEPGEGSSIMSYANVCGSAVQYASNSDPFFHYASIDQIQTFANTISCAVTNSAGNSSDPVPDAKSDFTIPKQTAFILVGDATDVNDAAGSLTYQWEQYDGSGSATTGSPSCSSTSAPMFRHRSPVSDNYRSLPTYSDVLAANNNSKDWEKLPCVARSMNFSLAVRDNNTTFGRLAHDQTVVTVADTGPFDVSAPNGGESIVGNTTSTITWTVNGTNSHCANVDILLSTDGGTTYTVIADAITNNGTKSITIPNTATTTARILVRCDVTGGFRSASTFYDVSNANFTITASLPVELLSFSGRLQNEKTFLNWSTASEENNAGFEVQRLSQNDQWEKLGFVEGNKTTNIENHYQFIDRKPMSGENYYRLKQVDIDGKQVYSNIVVVNTKGDGTVSVHPNPFIDQIYLTGLRDDCEVTVFNANGGVVFEEKVSFMKATNLKELASGVYFISLKEEGRISHHKIVKH